MMVNLTTDTTSKPEPTRNAQTKRRLVALRGLPVSQEPCEVPGCESSKLEGLDCCYEHSLHDAHNAAPNNLPNDGIIDWVAIDLAVQDARPVRLTYIERNIALAKLIDSGMPPTTAADRLGMDHATLTRGRRVRELTRILEALPHAA